MELQSELEETKSAHSKAAREAEEARGLWETEVKSRSKLGIKVQHSLVPRLFPACSKRA